MERPERRPGDWLTLYLKGMAMGAADSVPGVSGGTVAFMTGIYEELVYSLQAMNHKAVQTLFTRGIPACWKQINGNFLLILLSGIVTSLLLLARLMVYLLLNHTPQVLAFFAGLIVASIVYLLRTGGQWRQLSLLAFIPGLALAVGLGMLPVFDSTPTLPVYFFGGMLAITAMVLPGISGAFILVLLGLYLPVLEALRVFDIPVVLVFALGCGSGLIAFSQVLGWLFHNHHAGTLQFLTGVLAGSLYNLWPWQLGPEGAGMPVLPGIYSETLGEPAHVFTCLLLLAAGFVLVTGLEYLQGRTARKRQ